MGELYQKLLSLFHAPKAKAPYEQPFPPPVPNESTPVHLVPHEDETSNDGGDQNALFISLPLVTIALRADAKISIRRMSPLPRRNIKAHESDSRQQILT